MAAFNYPVWTLLVFLTEREHQLQTPNPEEIELLHQENERFMDIVMSSPFDGAPNCFEELPMIFKPKLTPFEVEQSVDVLHSFHQWSARFSVPYTLTQGTLLGQIRHFGPIGHDDDADVAVSAMYEPLLFSVALGQILVESDKGSRWGSWILCCILFCFIGVGPGQVDNSGFAITCSVYNLLARTDVKGRSHPKSVITQGLQWRFLRRRMVLKQQRHQCFSLLQRPSRGPICFPKGTCPQCFFACFSLVDKTFRNLENYINK